MRAANYLSSRSATMAPCYGALLKIAGEERSALPYDIGNPVTASL